MDTARIKKKVARSTISSYTINNSDVTIWVTGRIECSEFMVSMVSIIGRNRHHQEAFDGRHGKYGQYGTPMFMRVSSNS